MDVKLPNGTIIRGVPEGTSKDEVMRKAIAAGLATPDDFAAAYSSLPATRERTIGEKVGGAAEAGLAMATGAIAEPLAGLKGLARTAWAGPEAGAAEVERTRQALTYQPGEVGQEYLQDIAQAPIISDVAESFQRGSQYAGQKALELTGSPAVAAITEALPAAGAAALGARAPKAAAGRLDTASVERAATSRANEAAAMAPVNVQAPQTSITSSAIKSLSPEEIRDIADVDPEFFKALEDVGVTADPLASYASQNPQFRGIEQGLAAMPGSSLSPMENAFRQDLSKKAADLFKQFGALDSGEASVKWRDNAMQTVRGLEDEANAAYDALGARIDRKQPAQPTSTVDLIETEVADLPIGILDSSAPAVLKQIFAEIQPRKRTNPDTGEVESIPANYASLDATRRKIGAAAFKNEGDFINAEKGLLKRVYGALTDDLNAMAESQGLVDEVKQAKAVVAKRKIIESQMEELLGSKLQKDIEPVVGGVVKDLAKQGIQKYKNVMSNIPEPEVRQQLVMTSLNNIFTGTRGGNAGDFLTADYLKWYNGTMKKPTLRKLIEADLPEGAAQKLDSLATIAEGVTRAKADKVRTGAINALLDDKAGMIRRMVGGTIQQTVGRLPGPTAEVASAVGSILKADTKRSAAAGELLASPEFANVIRKGVAEGVITGRKASEQLKRAESQLMKSQKYKAWANTLRKEELELISSVGLAAYLTNQQEGKQ
jgi:hypothetical protein